MIPNSKLLSLLLLFLIILTSCNTECSHDLKNVDDSRPSNAITYKEMANMFHAYDVGQKTVLDAYRKELTRGKDPIESISHFYDLKDLKQYIAYLEKLSKDKNIELTGIRIFSAAYPKDYSQINLRGRHTLIFMPTANIDNEKAVAFEPLYSNKGEPIRFTKFLNQFSSKESKQVVRASFLPNFNIVEDVPSSGANRLNPSPPM